MRREGKDIQEKEFPTSMDLEEHISHVMSKLDKHKGKTEATRLLFNKMLEHLMSRCRKFFL